MLGTLDGKGNPDDPDPVERESAKVQCVVARAAPTNFFTMRDAGISFLGMAAPAGSGRKRRNRWSTEPTTKRPDLARLIRRPAFPAVAWRQG